MSSRDSPLSHCDREAARPPHTKIATDGARVFCNKGGGLGGVMEAACHGSKDAGGTTVGIALGCSGLRPVEDARGSKDLFGKELTITSKATADNLVSAAQLIMGEAGEGIPAVVVRGLDGIADENCEIPIFSKDECMYYSNITQ